jgi:hypothetical protein
VSVRAHNVATSRIPLKASTLGCRRADDAVVATDGGVQMRSARNASCAALSEGAIAAEKAPSASAAIRRAKLYQEGASRGTRRDGQRCWQGGAYVIVGWVLRPALEAVSALQGPSCRPRVRERLSGAAWQCARESASRRSLAT